MRAVRKSSRYRFQENLDSPYGHNIDLNKDPNENLMEILKNIIALADVSSNRKLNHLNNLVKLYLNLEDDFRISVPTEVIIICLKVTLISESKEVRAAGVRALRYIINDHETVQIMVKNKLDNFITRCLDIEHFNELERIQVIRLIRKLTSLEKKDATAVIPRSIVACVASISLGGAVERDRVYRTCIAVLCELALIQPWLVLDCSGVLALSSAVMECHIYKRISECVSMTLMYLVTPPNERLIDRMNPVMSSVFAPYTEHSYRLHADKSNSDENHCCRKEREKQEILFFASRMAIVSLFRIWSGLFHIRQSVISSLVEAINIPKSTIRKEIFTVLSDIFHLNEPVYTDNFDDALKGAVSVPFRDSWRLSEDFVAGEAQSLIPPRCVSRPDLVDCHLALLLSRFLSAGLLETLAKLCVGSDAPAAVASNILLGCLLKLSSRLLPRMRHVTVNERGEETSDFSSSCKHHSISWDTRLHQLLKSSSTSYLVENESRISLAVNRLCRIQSILNNLPQSYSIYLNRTISSSSHHHHKSSNKQSTNIKSTPERKSSRKSDIKSDIASGLQSIRRGRGLNIWKDLSETKALATIKASKVLITKEEWDWDVLHSMFINKPSRSFFQSSNDQVVRRFFRRLADYYSPESQQFSALDASKEGFPDKNRKKVITGCNFLEFLSTAEQDGRALAKNLIRDILQLLKEVKDKSINFFRTTCQRDYILIIGSLSSTPSGLQLMRETYVFDYFMGLAAESTPNILIKLMISSLQYNTDSQTVKIFEKVLKCCNEKCKLYAANYLRTLLRCNSPNFHVWGLRLITSLLQDDSDVITSQALDIIDEACDDSELLEMIILLRPPLLPFGDRGVFLTCRYLSSPRGFDYLSSINYLNKEFDRWWDRYNDLYVTYIEELLKISLTTHERFTKGEAFIRRSNSKKHCQPVYLPAHLYGELCKLDDGVKLVKERGIVDRLVGKLKEIMEELQLFSAEITDDDKEEMEDDEDLCVKPIDYNLLNQAKACMWGLAHIGASTRGLPLIDNNIVIPTLDRLTRTCKFPSIRGSGFYCMCLISQTVPGVQLLYQHNWQGLSRSMNKVNDGKGVNYMTRCMSTRSDQSFVFSPNSVFSQNNESSRRVSLASSSYETSYETSSASSSLTVAGSLKTESRTQEWLNQTILDTNEPQRINQRPPVSPSSKMGNGLNKPYKRVIDFMNSIRSSKSSLSVKGKRNRTSSTATDETHDSLQQVDKQQQQRNHSQSQNSSVGNLTIVSDTIAAFEERAAKQDSNANNTNSAVINTSKWSIPSVSKRPASNDHHQTSGWNSNNSGLTALQRQTFYMVNHCEMCAASRKLGETSTLKQSTSFDERRTSSLLRDKMVTPFRRPSLKSMESGDRRGSTGGGGSFRSKARGGGVGGNNCSCPCHRQAPPSDYRILIDSSSSGPDSFQCEITPNYYMSSDFITREPTVFLHSELPAFQLRYKGICLPFSVDDFFLTRYERYERMKKSQADDDMDEQQKIFGSYYPVSSLRVKDPIKKNVEQTNLESDLSAFVQDHASKQQQRATQKLRQLKEIAESNTSDSHEKRFRIIRSTPHSLLSNNSDLAGGAADITADEIKSISQHEVFRLIQKLGCSVGVKTHETALLILKEKQAEIFNSVDLYNKVIDTISCCRYRLTTRRFIQELFQDVKFTEVYTEAHEALNKVTMATSTSPSTSSSILVQ